MSSLSSPIYGFKNLEVRQNNCEAFGLISDRPWNGFKWKFTFNKVSTKKTVNNY